MRFTFVFRCLMASCFLFFLSCGEADYKGPRNIIDADGDGHILPRNGGGDCNDNDPKINPENKEVVGDGQDNNCNGQVDEFTGNPGRWSLNVPNIADGVWNIQLRTHKITGQQYIRCVHFKFKLKSTSKPNLTSNITFWRARMDPVTDKEQEGKWVYTIPVTNNKFDWTYKTDQNTLSIRFQGELTSNAAMRGALQLIDTDPNVMANTTVAFTGKHEASYDTSEQTKLYCQRCIELDACPAI